MAKRRVSMNKIRETIRLHQEAGLSNRQIARALGISRPSVSQYLSDYRSSGLSYSAIAAMSDDELVGMLEGVKIELSERYQDLSASIRVFCQGAEKDRRNAGSVVAGVQAGKTGWIQPDTILSSFSGLAGDRPGTHDASRAQSGREDVRGLSGEKDHGV